MKKIKIFMSLLGFITFGINVFAGQGASKGAFVPGRKGTVSTQRPRAATAPQRTLARTSRTTVRQTRPVATRGGKSVAAAPAAIARPISVDELVWDTLSDDQKKQFNSLKADFEKTVSTLSKDYALWQKRIVEKAKKIIDIDVLLIGYCMDIIRAELDKTAEIRGVDAAEKSNDIQDLLDEHVSDVQESILRSTQQAQAAAREDILSEGSIKDQFNNLMKKENVWLGTQSGKQWYEAVVKRAKILVYQQQLSLKDVQVSLIKALRSANFSDDAIKRVIRTIVDEVNMFVKERREAMSPEAVNRAYQALFVSTVDAESWNNLKNQPTDAWIKQIIAASRNKVIVFGTPIDEIKRQIGAQLFFIATSRVNRKLNSVEEESMMNIINDIVNNIQQ